MWHVFSQVKNLYFEPLLFIHTKTRYKYSYFVTYIYIHIHIYIYVYIYIYIYMCVCVYMYIHIYMYINVYIYSNIYIYMHIYPFNMYLFILFMITDRKIFWVLSFSNECSTLVTFCPFIRQLLWKFTLRPCSNINYSQKLYFNRSF